MAAWNNFFQNDSGNPADDLQSMAAMAKANGVKVIICTVYAYDPAHPAPWMVPAGAAPVTFYDMWRTPFNKTIGQIQSASFVDFSALFDGQSDYTVDGIHPNDSGYSQMGFNQPGALSYCSGESPHTHIETGWSVLVTTKRLAFKLGSGAFQDKNRQRA